MNHTIQIKMTPDSGCVMRESVQIPHFLEKIHITVNRISDFPGAGFLAVLDEKGILRLQKMIAYGEQELGIGIAAQDNSIGSVAGEIGAGEWTVIFGTPFLDWNKYEGPLPIEFEVVISDEEKEITEPMDTLWLTDKDAFHINNSLHHADREYDSAAKWYKGDFHTHTRLSDGKETVRNAMKKAMDMDMNFYVPTEHNAVHTGWVDTGVCIIPGVEITLDWGHYNLFGITERPALLDAMMMTADRDKLAEYMLTIIEEANEKGWPVSINHPFLHVWKWHLNQVSLDKVQCLEIINDPTYDYAVESNDKAISYLDALWQDGHRIIGIGGSDSHNLIDERYTNATEPSIAGDPGTYVYSKGLSPNKILEAVCAGHVVVTRYCTIVPEIYSADRKYLPGDELTENEITYELEIAGIAEEPVVSLIGSMERETIDQRKLPVRKTENGTYAVSVEVTLPKDKWSWVRMEVRDQKGLFLGYTNPVYSGRKESKYHTFGEVKEVWGLE